MSFEGEIGEIDLIQRLVELGRERFTGATSAPSGASKMLVRILHGIAVLLALLGIVLLDRALAEPAPNAATEEIATFASRFSALTDALPAPASPEPQNKSVPVAEPQKHSAQPPKEAQPFALDAEPVKDGDVIDKWDGLNADMRAESATLALAQTRPRPRPG